MTSFGTDAQKWARQFINNGPMAIDEDVMLSWFANAIMAGHDEARREYEMVNRHEHSMSMLGIDTKPEASRPEPININELKRLLVEVVSDILDTRDKAMSYDEWARNKKRLVRQIESAILNGDDS